MYYTTSFYSEYSKSPYNRFFWPPYRRGLLLPVLPLCHFSWGSGPWGRWAAKEERTAERRRRRRTKRIPPPSSVQLRSAGGVDSGLESLRPAALRTLQSLPLGSRGRAGQRGAGASEHAKRTQRQWTTWQTPTSSSSRSAAGHAVAAWRKRRRESDKWLYVALAEGEGCRAAGRPSNLAQPDAAERETASTLRRTAATML